MSQSSLAAAVLLGMFVLFIAVRGRLNTYTDILWGGGGKGGGTLPKESDKGPIDKEGDGFDGEDAGNLLRIIAPYPFNIPFELMSED